MNTTPRGKGPLLAIFPTSIGFGYSLHKDADTFIDWGIKWATGDKNKVCLRKFITLVNLYRPSTLILEDIPKDKAEQRPRTAELINAVAQIAATQNIIIRRYSRAQIRTAFEAQSAQSKQQIAEAIGASIPELKPFVPPMRKLWEPDQSAMSFFSAVSLALTHYHFKPGA